MELVISPYLHLTPYFRVNVLPAVAREEFSDCLFVVDVVIMVGRIDRAFLSLLYLISVEPQFADSQEREERTDCTRER